MTYDADVGTILEQSSQQMLQDEGSPETLAVGVCRSLTRSLIVKLLSRLAKTSIPRYLITSPSVLPCL